MSEFCPLPAGGGASSWNEGIPSTCQEQCSALWEQAAQTQEPYLDTFASYCSKSDNDPCTHYVEFGGEALDRPRDPADSSRNYHMNYECMTTAEEMYSEGYSFVCPFNDPSYPPRINFLD